MKLCVLSRNGLRATAVWLVALIATPLIADDLVVDWNAAMLAAVRIDKTTPPQAARAFAMVHIAMFDAANAIDRDYHPYAYKLPAPRHASPEAAASFAAHRVLVELFPAHQATFDQLLEDSLDGIPLKKKLLGGLVGLAAAQTILWKRANDGSTNTVSYTPGTDPGGWQPTPPLFAPALLPQWAYVKPFGMKKSQSFRPIAPPPIDSVEYAIAFEEVRLFGAATGSMRTADQSEIAQFWADGPGTATPPGHWNRIAQGLATDFNLNLVESARLFALLNIAEADAAICSWDAKYYYDYWRPVTAIRSADLDDNPLTQPDPTWSSFIGTPPFPSYTSGHSTFSSAAAAVLADFFENDNIPFSSVMDGNPAIVRYYASFSEAAEEAGQSRIYGGIHWQFDNTAALQAGGALGAYVSDKYLRPKHNR